MLNRITAALFDSDLIMSRLTLAIAEALWAILLWWPGPIFHRPAYAGMATVMSEHAWGLVFALSAVTQANIVVQGHCTYAYARIFAAWNAVLWGYVVVSVLLAVQPPPAAIAGELTLALLAAWVWWRPILLCAWSVKAHREGAQIDD